MWYDAIIAALLIFCTVRGASKGFAWQVAAIAALVVCFLFAETASLAIAPMINVKPPLNRWLAMFGLYIGASFVSFGLARTIRTTLEKWQFVEYDKHLGAIFGAIKGVGFALVITFFAVTLTESLRATVLSSYSGNAAGHILSALHPVMPDGLHAVIDPYLERLGQPVAHGDDPFGPHPDRPGQDPLGPDFGTAPDFGSSPVTGTRPSRPTGKTPATPVDFGPVPAGFEATPRDDAPRTLPATGGDDLKRIVDSLPGLSNDLKGLALTALENTSPQDRAELVDRFRTAIPGLVKAVATEWRNGKPADADRLTKRDRTLREIAAIYTDSLPGQQSIVREAEGRLRGLPDEVSLVVVQDWYADLLELTPDPDPQTDLATPLDTRIIRQLRSFDVPVDSLSADVRDRLRAVR